MADICLGNITFDTPCSRYVHNTCRKIQQDILCLHKKGKKVTKEFLTRYIQYLTISLGWGDKCMFRTNNWVFAMTKIFAYLTPDTDELKYMLNTDTHHHIVDMFKILVDRGEKIDDVLLKHAIRSSNFAITKYLMNIIEQDIECLELACEHMIDVEDILMEILNRKIIPTKKCLWWSLNECNIEMSSTLIRYGAVPDMCCLEIACKLKLKDMVEKILEFGVKPTKKCVKNLLTRGKVCKGVINVTDTIAETIDILVQHGYVVDYDDVCYGLSQRYYINDVSHVQFKPTFFDECVKYKYFPYEDIGYKPTTDHIISLCSIPRSLFNIKKLCNMGVKPDKKCMQAACKNKHNFPIIKYLHETHGIPIDTECLKEYTSCFGNKTLTYLVSNMNKKRAPGCIEYLVPKRAPKSKRKRQMLPAKITKFFKLPKAPLSFYEIKKIICQYIENNQLYLDGNKKIIKPNRPLCNLLKLKRNKCIEYAHIDTIVYRCYA